MKRCSQVTLKNFCQKTKMKVRLSRVPLKNAFTTFTITIQIQVLLLLFVQIKLLTSAHKHTTRDAHVINKG